MYVGFATCIEVKLISRQHRALEGGRKGELCPPVMTGTPQSIKSSCLLTLLWSVTISQSFLLFHDLDSSEECWSIL